MTARRSFRRDRRGVTAVEFTLLAPVLLTLICGTVEFGHFYLEQTSLDGALIEAARTASSTQENSEDARDVAMRTSVANAMSSFQLATGQHLSIATTVYADFTSAQPEPFVDTNHNGVYDPPAGANAGEPFTDRNGNGHWDPAVAKSGKEGGPGDVVSYTAVYPAAYMFGWMRQITRQSSITLRSTVVTRNEPVKTS